MLSRSMNCVNRAHPFAVNVVFMGKVEQSLSVLQRKMVTCLRSRVIDLFRRLWFMRSMIGSGLGFSLCMVAKRTAAVAGQCSTRPHANPR